MKHLLHYGAILVLCSSSLSADPLFSAAATAATKGAILTAKAAVIAGKVALASAGVAAVSTGASYAYQPYARRCLRTIVDELGEYTIVTDDTFKQRSSDGRSYAKTIGAVCLQKTIEYLQLHETEIPATRIGLAKLIAGLPITDQEQEAEVRQTALIFLKAIPVKQEGILKAYTELVKVKQQEVHTSIDESTQ